MYEPRRVTFHGAAQVSETRVKRYAIAAAGREAAAVPPPSSLIADALGTPGMSRLAHLGLGYVILHAGEDVVWLLARLWLPGGIVAGELSTVVDGERIPVDAPLIECVWEAAPAHHERDAWVRHMMASNDPGAYLDDALPDGAY